MDESRNDGATCRGGGSAPGFSVEECPPGRMNVISSYQRICCSTPSRL
jgi:hypothetical protein